MKEENNQTISKELIEMIKKHEGYKGRVYLDTQFIPTIGYGRNLKAHPLSEAEERDIKMNLGVYGKKEAEEWLKNHLEGLYNELSKYRWFHKLDSVRQSIILDMAYNLGIPRLLLFKKMILALNSADYDNASHEMLNSSWAMQVKERAKKLSVLMREHKDDEVRNA
ncbi:hypothetical protein BKH41_02955 [Helicobacter sp. 12S02232-10]|uniref:glycoside hydrolase family protein n=1 Tax=Helicobacter sp. 12S02232-10 TaxID=1476197 RepID=UPI000BA788AD|nr:glycoside hydrolase [Helicobacter sp. 12S02232-10]PAF49065.1 hypothetical protein BKH41_02955 [Helicobacter sp. 12S02232-10]